MPIQISRPSDNLRIHPSHPDTILYVGDSEESSGLYIGEDRGDTWTEYTLDIPPSWRLEVIESEG